MIDMSRRKPNVVKLEAVATKKEKQLGSKKAAGSNSKKSERGLDSVQIKEAGSTSVSKSLEGSPKITREVVSYSALPKRNRADLSAIAKILITDCDCHETGRASECLCSKLNEKVYELIKVAATSEKSLASAIDAAISNRSIKLSLLSLQDRDPLLTYVTIVEVSREDSLAMLASKASTSSAKLTKKCCCSGGSGGGDPDPDPGPEKCPTPTDITITSSMIQGATGFPVRRYVISGDNALTCEVTTVGDGWQRRQAIKYDADAPSQQLCCSKISPIIIPIASSVPTYQLDVTPGTLVSGQLVFPYYGGDSSCCLGVSFTLNGDTALVASEPVVNDPIRCVPPIDFDEATYYSGYATIAYGQKDSLHFWAMSRNNTLAAASGETLGLHAGAACGLGQAFAKHADAFTAADRAQLQTLTPYNVWSPGLLNQLVNYWSQGTIMNGSAAVCKFRLFAINTATNQPGYVIGCLDSEFVLLPDNDDLEVTVFPQANDQGAAFRTPYSPYNPLKRQDNIAYFHMSNSIKPLPIAQNVPPFFLP